MTAAELARRLHEAGAPVEAILLALEAFEARDDILQDRLAQDAAKSARYRARRDVSETVWVRLSRQVIAASGVCAYCGSTANLTCDHVVPLSRGGTSEASNLVAACRSCNSSKAGQLIAEWRR